MPESAGTERPRPNDRDHDRNGPWRWPVGGERFTRKMTMMNETMKPQADAPVTNRPPVAADPDPARRHCLQLGAAALAATLASAAAPLRAQASWPDRPLTLVVPFPPGGVADTVGRPFAEGLGRALGQPVVVENKAGAGGGIGMAQVAKARPDGQTLLLALSSLTVLPHADALLGRAPLYRLDELAPIARVTNDPTVLVVRGDSPWRDLAGFLADARARPGQISYGSSGLYGTMQIPMEMLKQATSTFLLHVPYTGAGPALVGLIGGQVDACASGPATVVQHIRSGRLRALAHWGKGRLAALPEVPSLEEMGLKISCTQWAGLLAPAGLPVPVLARLGEAAATAAGDERVVKAIGTAGTPVQYLDAPSFAAFIADDSRTMATVVQRIGRQG